MRYNVYRKCRYYGNTYTYVKKRVGDYYECIWISVEDLNDKCYKDYTKVSLNIFKAKQIMNEQKALDKQHYPEYIIKYWIERVKD